jgi:hypothetical protein
MGDPFRSGTVGAVWVEGDGLCSEGFGDALTHYLGTNGRLGWYGSRVGPAEADHLASETEALLSFFLGLLRGVCLDNLVQAGAGSHRELQLALKRRDCLERISVVLMNRSKVSVGREDADAAREATEVAARRTVLVVLRDVHRMEPDSIHSVPGKDISQGPVEDRKPVIGRPSPG